MTTRHDIAGQPPLATAQPGNTFLVSQFVEGRWHDRLATRDLEKARGLLKQYGSKGRMLQFPGATEVR